MAVAYVKGSPKQVVSLSRRLKTQIVWVDEAGKEYRTKSQQATFGQGDAIYRGIGRLSKEIVVTTEERRQESIAWDEARRAQRIEENQARQARADARLAFGMDLLAKSTRLVVAENVEMIVVDNPKAGMTGYGDQVEPSQFVIMIAWTQEDDREFYRNENGEYEDRMVKIWVGRPTFVAAGPNNRRDRSGSCSSVRHQDKDTAAADAIAIVID